MYEPVIRTKGRYNGSSQGFPTTLTFDLENCFCFCMPSNQKHAMPIKGVETEIIMYLAIVAHIFHYIGNP